MLFVKPYRFWRYLVLLAIGLTSSVAMASSNSGITYHGRILNPGGIPVTDSNVQFKMQVLTPDSQNCVMFQEIQTKDLSSSGGSFSITINDGTGVQTFYGYTLDQILGNRGTFNLSPAICSTGTGTWTPNVSDGRAFIVSFKTSSMSSWEQLPSQSINFAPFAIEAKQVAGFSGDTLLRVEDPTTGPSAIRSLTPTEGAELLNIVDGTSTKYIPSTANGATLPTFATAPGSPAAGDMWYDSTNNLVKYYDGTTTQTVGGNSGSSITTGTIGGSTAVNTTGNIQTTGNVVSSNVSSTTDSTTSLKIYESTVTNAITITAPASLAAGGYPLVLPNNKATVAGQALTSDTSGNLSWTSLGSGTTGFYQNGGNSFGAAATLGTNDANKLSFKTNNSTAMTIDTSGRVGIGNTSPISTLDARTGTDQNFIVFPGTGLSLADGIAIGSVNDANSATKSMGFQASKYSFQGGTVGIGTATPSATYALDVTGDVRATSGMYAVGFYYTSDQRLKENVQTIENPIEKIMALRGVNFQWKETKKQDMGFIAQEVEQVLPEVMGTRPDKTYGEIKTVKYANIVALTVEAIKDLYSKWQGDHRDLASLKAEVEQLKSDNDNKNQQIQALEKRLEKLESQQH